MNGLIKYSKRFNRNQGLLVFLSFFVQKFCAFLTTIIVIHLLSKEEFGLLSIVPAIFTAFAAFTGLGLPVGLLRFGAAAKNSVEKQALIDSTFRDGFLYQILFSVMFFAASLFFIEKFTDITILFAAFAVRLLGMFFMLHVPTVFRINFKNKAFAHFNIIMAVVGLILAAIFSNLWGLYGYLLAIAIHPYLALLWKEARSVNLSARRLFNKKELYNFSLHSAFTNFISEFLFTADFLILSYFLTESSIASYRVAILIPSNLVFIGQSFLQSDYAEIVSKSKDLKFLRKYTADFYRLFMPVILLIFAVGFVLRKYIITFFFGEKYLDVALMYTVLLAAFLLSILLRVLYGNLLSAIGQMPWVTAATALSVVVLVLAAMILVPAQGVEGMVYSMALALTFGGIMMAFSFWNGLKKFK